ncbi:MAG: hypothetical protein ACE5GS_16945 [Kiloniellaceae bacterium]
MDHLIHLFTAVVLIAATLAGIAVGSPRAVWVKLSALGLAALLMATGYAGLLDLLGKPKPVALEWDLRAVADARVLGVDMRENEAIYVWLRFDGAVEPRGYVLPWSLANARQLQQAMRDAQAQGTAVRMRRPFEPRPESNEPLFYAEPQPALPPKLPPSVQRSGLNAGTAR